MSARFLAFAMVTLVVWRGAPDSGWFLLVAMGWMAFAETADHYRRSGSSADKGEK